MGARHESGQPSATMSIHQLSIGHAFDGEGKIVHPSHGKGRFVRNKDHFASSFARIKQDIRPRYECPISRLPMVRPQNPDGRSGRSNWTGSPRRSSDILDGPLDGPDHLDGRSGLSVQLLWLVGWLVASYLVCSEYLSILGVFLVAM